MENSYYCIIYVNTAVLWGMVCFPPTFIRIQSRDRRFFVFFCVFLRFFQSCESRLLLSYDVIVLLGGLVCFDGARDAVDLKTPTAIAFCI